MINLIPNFIYDSLLLSVKNLAQYDGDFHTEIPMLSIYRRSKVTDPMPCIYGLGLGITLQGEKRVILGKDIFNYTSKEALINFIDLPVTSHVTQASSIHPYIGIRLELDSNLVIQLAMEMNNSKNFRSPLVKGMSIIRLDEQLFSAIKRLIDLINEPKKIPFIAPLIQREIIIRLLDSEHGETLRHFAEKNSPNAKIFKILTWMKLNYSSHISIDELAAKVNMSSSTFRQHFRTITGLSPLQYLKSLRLQDARNWLLQNNMDITKASTRVGYQSITQFNREYARMFGEPPIRDIKRIQKQFTL